ncbi:MAG: PRC-barrel domain containing protein [Gaiellaceae bacterium]
MERQTTTDPWTYRDAETLGADLGRGMDLVGFSVEATDGGIGKIDEATYDASRSYVVVDTGPWIFGKKVMLPAGVIQRVDLDDQSVFVERTKDEIKNAPEFDERRYTDEAYREELGGYYYGGTRRDTDVF